MNTPAIQLPEPRSLPQGNKPGAVLVRSNHTDPLTLEISNFMGSPPHNIIAMRILAEAVRAQLNLSELDVLCAGEFYKGFIYVEVRSLAVAFVVTEILTLLKRLSKEEYFAILIHSYPEEFFRTFHQGAYFTPCALVTPAQIAQEAAAWRKEIKSRTATITQALKEPPPKK